MKTLLQAIAFQEGYYNEGDRPQRNSNPGDLIWCDEAAEFGAIHGDPEFAVFPDARTGWIALQRWLSVPARLHRGPAQGFPFLDPNGTTLLGGYMGATLAQVIYRFAPPSSNATNIYLANVVLATGLLRTTIVTADILQTPEAA